jgi:membrane associated rhomboid family serine protease
LALHERIRLAYRAGSPRGISQGWLGEETMMRALVVASLAIVGTSVGALIDMANRANGMGGFVVAPAGLVVGLLAGLLLARTFPRRRPRRRLDPARYPNRVIRRG